MNLSHQKDPLIGQNRRDDKGRSRATQGVATPMRATPAPHLPSTNTPPAARRGGGGGGGRGAASSGEKDSL